MTAPKLTPERREQLARVARAAEGLATVGDEVSPGYCRVAEALHAEIAKPVRAALAHGSTDLNANVCFQEPLANEIYRAVWELKTERDALQKRVAELEAQRAEARRQLDIAQRTDDGVAALSHVHGAQCILDGNVMFPCDGTGHWAARPGAASEARVAHNEACAKWVREHGRRALHVLRGGFVSGGPPHYLELRALLKDEET